MSASWFWPRDAWVQAKECSYHGWDGPCLKPCRSDDRYLAEDGRSFFLCANHRSPRRMPNRVYVNRTDTIVVYWAGDDE